MRPHRLVPLTTLALAGALAVATPAVSRTQATFEVDVRPFLEKHCLECHAGAEPEGELNLASYDDAEAVVRDWPAWRDVRDVVTDGEMPPADRPRPDSEDLARFVEWVDGALARADRHAPRDPGRVTMRRLNRLEYRNTVRDLLGVDFRGTIRFPADDVGYGYDSVGDVLTLPPLLMERYLDAAEEIARDTVVLGGGEPRRFLPDELSGTQGSRAAGGSWILFAPSSVTASFDVQRPGEYEIRVRTWGQQAGPDPCVVRIAHGREKLADFEVPETRDDPRTVSVRVRLPQGRRPITAAFVNDYYRPDDPDPAQRDRNLAVDWIEVAGPLGPDAEQMPEPHRRLFAPDPGGPNDAARRRAILTPLAKRAFRRPVTRAEMRRFESLARDVQSGGASFEHGIQVALQAVLVSPHFLFRVERHPEPGDADDVRPLDDHALATRLSYFLWASMPDDELRATADAGRLHDELGAHVRRMLRDPRATTLVTNFAAQWLQLRLLEDAKPDPDRFPHFDDELRRAMRVETETFVASVFAGDRPVTELLSARHTFVNARLARHYGIDGVDGDAFLRVELPDGRRGGLLGHASILTLTSYPTRTSPVKRGKWLLEQIVGRPTPPPPPGVGDLPESGEHDEDLSLKERLERHRTDPSCNSCHARLDPLGFALENFDAVGRWRDADRAGAVDARAEMPNGDRFEGLPGLRDHLLDGDDFVRHFVRNLMTYALGRGLSRSDEAAVERVVAEAREGGPRFGDLVLGVAQARPFRMHRGESTEESR